MIAHQRIGIDRIGVLLEDRQIGELADLERAKLVGHADLARGVDRDGAQRVGQRHRLLGPDDRAIDAHLRVTAVCTSCSVPMLEQGASVWMVKGSPRRDAVGGRVHPRGALGAE